MARTKNKTVETREVLQPMEGPELVFGLVGAVGANLDQVAEILEDELTRVGYRTHTIRVSSLLYQIKEYRSLGTNNFHSDFKKISAHMEAGSALRSRTGRGDILALMSVLKIRKLRQENFGSPDRPPANCRTAYILRSLKHPQEITSLRDIYGRAFYLIAAYSPRGARHSSLAARIARSVHSTDVTRFRDQAERLIQIDEQEDRKLGQNVRDAFPMADFFVDARVKTEAEKSIRRLVELLFGHLFHTPTRDEFAMFHAHATALRSADLGRQVGAAITTAVGDIIAVGCNDVPRFGGGLYWPEDTDDKRDFRLGSDSNTIFRTDLVTQLIIKLKESRMLSVGSAKQKPQQLSAQLLRGRNFKETIAASVIEFGRSVHAEMAAISDAARRGTSLLGAVLYSTTFPCHLCARHIVAAGIEKVVYITPYPKSVAGRLYDDSISVDATDSIKGKVEFKPFVGIAPSIYTEMFKVGNNQDRKTESGKAIKWSPTKAVVKLRRFVPSYVMIEQQVVGELLPELLAKYRLGLTQR